MAAGACAFTLRAGFTFFGRLAALIFAFRGLLGFACATARTVRLSGLRCVGSPNTPPDRLHGPQAITW